MASRASRKAPSVQEGVEQFHSEIEEIDTELLALMEDDGFDFMHWSYFDDYVNDHPRSTLHF